MGVNFYLPEEKIVLSLVVRSGELRIDKFIYVILY